MSFVEMTNEEWEEVRRRHDAMVRMGELELQSEEIRETPRASSRVATIDLPVRPTEEVVARIQH